MTLLSIKRVSERCMWAALLFCTIYQSYRYPLQYNSTGTSPTYTDTPLAFQAAKFVVVLFLCLPSAYYIFHRRLPFRKWMLAISIVFMSAYPAFRVINAENKVSYLDVAFWPLAALVFVLATTRITAKALDKYFRFVLFYGLISTAVEVLLFVTIGRLPALAYANSFLVRFGGFLDDPNGFAAVLYMLGGWTYYRFSGAKCFFVEASLVICVLLTQSLTAYAFLVIVTILFLGDLLIRRRWLIALPLIAVLATITGVVLSAAGPLISIVMKARSGSVGTHLAQITDFQAGNSLWWLLGDFSYHHYESGWLGLFVNLGFFWVVLNISIVLTLTLFTWLRFRRARDLREKAVLAGVLGLSFYFIVGSSNLPFFEIFPINFLFFFLSYLVYFEKIQSGNASPVEHPLHSGDNLKIAPHAIPHPLDRPALD